MCRKQGYFNGIILAFFHAWKEKPIRIPQEKIRAVVITGGILFFLLPPITAAAPAPEMSHDLTMESLFEIVAGRHPLVERVALNPEIALKDRETTLTRKHWRFKAAQSYYYSEPVDPSAFTPGEIREYSWTAGVNKAIWDTGGCLSLEMQAGITDQNFSSISFPPSTGATASFSPGIETFYRQGIFANYTQPILQNYRGVLDRLDYQLSAFDVHIETYRAREQQETFFLEIGTLFLEWVLFAEKTEIVEKRLQLARKERDFVTEKWRAHLVDHVDVLRAEDAVRIAQGNKRAVIAGMKARRDTLAVLSKTDAIRDMHPEFDLYAIPDPLSRREMIDMVRNHSRLLAVVDVQKRRLQLLRRGFREQSKPRLDLNIGAGYAGGGESTADALDQIHPEVRLSLRFAYPFGGRAADVKARKAKLQLRQLDLQYEQILLDLISRCSSLRVRMEEMARILVLNRKQIASAMERVSEEQKLYRQGRGQLNFVIQSRDNLQNAQLRYAENAAAYHHLILNYRELTDRLFEADGARSTEPDNTRLTEPDTDPAPVKKR